MSGYAPLDPYAKSRYEQGIDAKVVVMGNTGSFSSLVLLFQSIHPVLLLSFRRVACTFLGVGKTSLLQRYTQNKFDPKNTTSTTGAFFVTKKIYVGGVKVRLQLWDTAGQERFRSMVRLLFVSSSPSSLTFASEMFRLLCIIEGLTPPFYSTTSPTRLRSRTFEGGSRVRSFQSFCHSAPIASEYHAHFSLSSVILFAIQLRHPYPNLISYFGSKWPQPPRSPLALQ